MSGTYSRSKGHQPLATRFWAKVDIGPPDQCWEWTAAKTNGYGSIGTSDGRSALAHRVAVQLDGRDPSGKVVRHVCNNRGCVNPRHLKVGTAQENMRDAVKAGSFYGKKRSRPRKLTSDDVLAIRRRAKDGESRQSLAAAFGVTDVYVGEIIRRKWWAWL